jgi:hypothetical protein
MCCQTLGTSTAEAEAAAAPALSVAIVALRILGSSDGNELYTLSPFRSNSNVEPRQVAPRSLIGQEGFCRRRLGRPADCDALACRQDACERERRCDRGRCTLQ